MPNATTIREAVLECFRAHGDVELALSDVEKWVANHYPRRWKGVGTDVSSLVIGPSNEDYLSHEQFLERVRRGVYRLAESHRLASSS